MKDVEEQTFCSLPQHLHITNSS